MPAYERRQVGLAMIAISLLQCATGVGVYFVSQVVGLVIVGVGLLTLWLFTTLTVAVDEEAVSVHFGPGLIRRRVALADIRASRVVTLPWYSGVGVHFTINGMLYNVAFGPVVQLELQNGRRVNIGSPEPDVLCAAIQERAQHAPSPHQGAAAHGLPWPLASAAVAACVALVVAAVVVWSGRRPVDITLGPEALTVSGAGYSTTIAMRDIVAVSLVDDLPIIESRTSGYAFGSRLRGSFRLTSLGASWLFVDRDEPPFILVRTSNATVLLNDASPEGTRTLFERLRRALPAR